MGPEVKLMEEGKRIEHQIYNHFQKNITFKNEKFQKNLKNFRIPEKI